MRILVIIPALNEAATVASVITELHRHGWRHVLVIDDGSTDRTAAVARGAGASVVRHPSNRGVGAAIQTGMQWAVEHGFGAVIQVDADGQHDPAALETLVRAGRRQRADLVVGSRWLDGGVYQMGVTRRLVTRALAAYASRSGDRSSVTDPTSGLRLIKGNLLHAFAAEYPAGYLGDTFGALVAARRAGYRTAEVPVVIHQRQGGAPSTAGLGLLWATLRAVGSVVAYRYRLPNSATYASPSLNPTPPERTPSPCAA